jgi:hypothetical protein
MLFKSETLPVVNTMPDAIPNVPWVNFPNEDAGPFVVADDC